MKSIERIGRLHWKATCKQCGATIELRHRKYVGGWLQLHKRELHPKDGASS